MHFARRFPLPCVVWVHAPIVLLLASLLLSDFPAQAAGVADGAAARRPAGKHA